MLSQKRPTEWEEKRTELGEALDSRAPLYPPAHAQALEGDRQQHRRDLFREVEKRLSHSLTLSQPQARKALKELQLELHVLAQLFEG